MDERRQTAILFRGFLLRFLDIELLSADGQMNKLLSQVAALLAAFSFVFVIYKVPQYHLAEGKYTAAQIAATAWGDQLFLVSATMMVVGMFSVIMWDSLLPDRRDALVLGPLPIRPRTIFAAKAAAIVVAIGLSILSINAFTGFIYPFLVARGGIPGAARAFAAYWLAMIAASAFLFCGLFAAQAAAMLVFSHARFLRVSGALQLAALFAIVAGFFLQPPWANPQGMAASEHRAALEWLPPFWFLGLFHKLNGTDVAAFDWLARRALWSVALASALATITSALTYGRFLHRIIDQAGIVPESRRRAPGRGAGFVARILFPAPFARALFLFTARTAARSRQHRMLLAIYGGIGPAIALLYVRELLYGRASWTQPGPELLAAGLVILFFAVLGMRLCFSLPAELRANWVFRLTEAGGSAVYGPPVRNALLALAALPVFLASTALYPALWPLPAAAAHLAILALFSLVVVQVALHGFRKIPFTCSYLPGKANLKVTFGAYAILILALTDFGVRIEMLALSSLRGFAILFALLAAALLWTRRHAAHALRPPHDRLMFDEKPLADVAPIELRSGEMRYGIGFARDGEEPAGVP